jgi:hypothetical protein
VMQFWIEVRAMRSSENLLAKHQSIGPEAGLTALDPA